MTCWYVWGVITCAVVLTVSGNADWNPLKLDQHFVAAGPKRKSWRSFGTTSFTARRSKRCSRTRREPSMSTRTRTATTTTATAAVPTTKPRSRRKPTSSRRSSRWRRTTTSISPTPVWKLKSLLRLPNSKPKPPNPRCRKLDRTFCRRRMYRSPEPAPTRTSPSVGKRKTWEKKELWRNSRPKVTENLHLMIDF